MAIHVYELSGRVWGFRLQPGERAHLAGHMATSESGATGIGFLRDRLICKLVFGRDDGLEYLGYLEGSSGEWEPFPAP